MRPKSTPKPTETASPTPNTAGRSQPTLKQIETPEPTKQTKPTSAPAPPPTEIRVYDILDLKRELIDDKIFLYQGESPSTVYRYEGFISGLKVMVEDGVAEKRYYLGEEGENGHLYGLANIAAFIGQSMKETIQYDACDENNWDFYFENPLVIYPLVSASRGLSAPDGSGAGVLTAESRKRRRSIHTSVLVRASVAK